MMFGKSRKSKQIDHDLDASALDAIADLIKVALDSHKIVR